MSRFLTGLFAALALLISGVPAAAQSIGYSPNTLPLSGSCGVVTVSTPCLDLTQTWNNVATTFTGLKLNVTDTASASGSLLMDLQVGGVSKLTVSKGGAISTPDSITTTGGNILLNNNYARLFFGSDVILNRDAANTLALRNGTAAQRFNLYETHTDASNYSRMVVGYGDVAAGYYSIQTQAGGTGTNRNFLFDAAGGLSRLTMNTSGFVFGSSTDNWWKITSAGHFIAGTDNTYDIGESGANRPRNLYVGDSLVFGNVGVVQAAGRSVWRAPSDGVWRATNAAGTNSVDFTVGAANLLTLNGGLKTTGATFALQTATTLTDNAAAQVATMTNGPTAGNPTKWIAINDNGTTRYIPAW